MSKMSAEDIMKNEIEQELANGLEALDMLEFFEQNLMKGKIKSLSGSHYDINKGEYILIQATVRDSHICGADLDGLYRKLQLIEGMKV